MINLKMRHTNLVQKLLLAVQSKGPKFLTNLPLWYPYRSTQQLTSFPGSLSYPLSRSAGTGRREPWERGCTVVTLVGCSNEAFHCGFGSFLLSPMKGEDFLVSEIWKKQKKLVRENLNQLNNILVSYETSVDVLTLA